MNNEIIGIRAGSVKQKPLTLVDVKEMARISTVNARMLKAQLNTYMALANMPGHKRDKEAQKKYERVMERIELKIEEETAWAKRFEAVIINNSK